LDSQGRLADTTRTENDQLVFTHGVDLLRKKKLLDNEEKKKKNNGKEKDSAVGKEKRETHGLRKY